MVDKPEKGGYVLDPESPAEMARLIQLDRFMTKGMGGPLVGVNDLSSIHNVLDMACGPGGWVLDVAFEHPELEVAGVDISRIMTDYASARARSQQITNASFEVMDITKPLEFSDGSFDLVNARFLFSVLSREQWPAFIAECTRLLRPGGTLRLTELIDGGATNSPAKEALHACFCEALWRTGYGFSVNGRSIGVTIMLPRFLRNAGYQDVRHLMHALEVSTGTEAYSDFYRNSEVIYQLAKMFFINTYATTEEEFTRLYEQMLIELLADDFCGMWHYMTALGTKA
ncbi:MAG TPA: class I SAM-dependent methyltransferase [Ktedonobacteraceae bacterium]|nr:class I SAM-dependent methyltransferase [Ktedonobacteraceae bacterium]